MTISASEISETDAAISQVLYSTSTTIDIIINYTTILCNSTVNVNAFVDEEWLDQTPPATITSNAFQIESAVLVDTLKNEYSQCGLGT